ncbi:hypothetical protein GCM10010918_51490 [Paenibacillus radicis (ex Gao et al. 2016)]|uniref:Uncharacterized protein n=1 Tax=Paenibacillus radicis (ex Gao et al. 2016) TaxID=1737354 RepID=A0A917HRJ9_9BACL|nr:hypothetical protein GCM10010918_51490 [Paenibacillus radicis (ex Gao et al. 2016)]
MKDPYDFSGVRSYPAMPVQTSKSIHPEWFPRFQYKELGKLFMYLGNIRFFSQISFSNWQILIILM